MDELKPSTVLVSFCPPIYQDCCCLWKTMNFDWDLDHSICLEIKTNLSELLPLMKNHELCTRSNQIIRIDFDWDKNQFIRILSAWETMTLVWDLFQIAFHLDYLLCKSVNAIKERLPVRGSSRWDLLWDHLVESVAGDAHKEGCETLFSYVCGTPTCIERVPYYNCIML